jgi:hypothetical protein
VPITDPLDISGCQLWLDASQLSLSDGDPVSSWTDLSGNARHHTMTGAERPTYKASILNSLAVVRFETSASQRVEYSSASYTVGSLFVVCNFDSAGNFPDFNGIFGPQAGGSAGAVGFSGTTNLYDGEMFNAYWMDGVLTDDFAPLASFKVVSASRASAGSIASSAVGSERNTSGRFWDGDIAEVVVYDTLLSSGDRQDVEAYLTAKWFGGGGGGGNRRRRVLLGR